jgi:hypothetical protein
MSWSFGFHKIIVEDTITAETAQELSDKMDDRIRAEGLNPESFDCKSCWCDNCNCWHHISVSPCEGSGSDVTVTYRRR